jgi:hypothetical protein
MIELGVDDDAFGFPLIVGISEDAMGSISLCFAAHGDQGFSP